METKIDFSEIESILDHEIEAYLKIIQSGKFSSYKLQCFNRVCEARENVIMLASEEERSNNITDFDQYRFNRNETFNKE